MNIGVPFPTPKVKSSVSLGCLRWRGPGQHTLFGDVDLTRRGALDAWLAAPAAGKAVMIRLQTAVLYPRILNACGSLVSLTLDETTVGDNSWLHHPSLASTSKFVSREPETY